MSHQPSKPVSRYLPRPMLSLTILVVWLAITNAASLGLFLLGLVLALLIPPCTRAFWPEAARPFRWGPAFRFLFVFPELPQYTARMAQHIFGGG